MATHAVIVNNAVISGTVVIAQDSVTLIMLERIQCHFLIRRMDLCMSIIKMDAVGVALQLSSRELVAWGVCYLVAVIPCMWWRKGG